MHEGHRRRMYEKLKNGDELYEHEVLEMLLFNAYPRTNTNPIAHSLLKAFGSISGVFGAEVEELIAIDGVGENVALYLKCIGECVKRSGSKNSVGVAVLKSYEDFKKFAALRLRGKTEELLEIYCLDKSGRVKSVSTFTNNEQNKVELGTEEISRIIATFKPYGLLLAHNHLSGKAQPSENDDIFTAKVQFICSMNNVNLYDHCVYASDGNIYSYFAAGKIDYIKKHYNFETMIGNRYKTVKENGAEK